MKRLEQLDALRGFALLGIVLGNVMWFSGYAVAPATDHWGLDATVAFGLKVFIDGKFYGLFSLLFGASFSLLVMGERTRGRSPGGKVVRRLGALFALGMAHAVLVWFGDILSLYAVAAVPLYVLVERGDRALGGWALTLLALPLVINGALLIWLGPAAVGFGGYGPPTELAAFATGSYRELFSANTAFLSQRWILALASGRLPRLLGMFVLGALLLRRRPTLSRRQRRVLLVVALASNVGTALLSSVPVLPLSGIGLMRDALVCVGVPTGALAYVAMLWPMLRGPGRITTALANAGRLSLTHYLGQSIVLAVIFYGVGLGMWGQLGASKAALVGGGLALIQILSSGAWLQRFGAGPGERVLRALDRALTRRPVGPAAQ